MSRKGRKMKLRKLVIAAAAASAVALVLSSCAGGGSGDGDGAEEGTLRIGYNSSQTGGLAYSDVPASTGVQLAVDEINAAGGIDGKWKIDLQIQDNRSDPGQSAVVAQDLLASGIDVQICTSDADPCIAAGQLAQAEGIPTISTAATSPTLPEAVGDHMFMSVFGDNTQTTVLADYALEQGYETAYMLCSPDSSYTSKSCEYFSDVFEKKGGTIVGQASYALGQPDFASVVTRIAGLSEAPQVIFTPAYPPDAPTFIRQLRAANIDTPVISMDGVDSVEMIAAGGDAVNGVVFTTHGYPEEGTPTGDFWKSYEEANGTPPESVFAATGYDLMKVIEAAVTEAQSIDPGDITAAINELVDVQGATGLITYKDQNRIPLKEVSLVKIENGAFSYLGVRTPDSADIPAP